jgi:hypothetical protein
MREMSQVEAMYDSIARPADKASRRYGPGLGERSDTSGKRERRGGTSRYFSLRRGSSDDAHCGQFRFGS